MGTIETLETVVMISAITSALSFLMLVSITISLVLIRDKIEKAVNILKIGLDVEEEKKQMKIRTKKNKNKTK